MNIDPELANRWEHLRKTGAPGMMETLSITITDLYQGSVQASMPVNDAVRQPFGLLHGGASVALAETVASLGSAILIDPQKKHATGIEINANHLRPVREGTVHARATMVHQGRQIHVWDIRLTDDNGRQTCLSRCTVAILPVK
ncbi:MAG: hotdog fold thioesterase [Cyclonatronaceae bacterium]